MTETTQSSLKYSCDSCFMILFDMVNYWDTTAYSFEFICGNCGKWHKYEHASSKTPTVRTK